MTRRYERSIHATQDNGAIRIESVLFKNVEDIQVHTVWVTPWEAGQLIGMLQARLTEMVG